MPLPYRMPDNWTHGDPCWADSALVKPLTGSHAGTAMHCESELAKALGFTLSAAQVSILFIDFINQTIPKNCKLCGEPGIVVSLITRYSYCKACWNSIYRATIHKIR